MTRNPRLLRSEAQAAVARVLRDAIARAKGGPGCERVADLAGVCATQVYEWISEEAQRQGPLWLLVQLDAATYRNVLAGLAALRLALYGELAPATREQSVCATLASTAELMRSAAGALADGTVDDTEAEALRTYARAVMRDAERLLARLGDHDRTEVASERA